MAVTYKEPEKKTFATGEAIFHAGEKADCAFLIESGEVKLFTDTMAEVATLGKGEIFGETAVIKEIDHNTSAFVSQDAQLVVIEKEILLNKLGQAEPMVAALLNSLAERLHMATDDDIGEDSSGQLSDMS